MSSPYALIYSQWRIASNSERNTIINSPLKLEKHNFTSFEIEISKARLYLLNFLEQTFSELLWNLVGKLWFKYGGRKILILVHLKLKFPKLDCSFWINISLNKPSANYFWFWTCGRFWCSSIWCHLLIQIDLNEFPQ